MLLNIKVTGPLNGKKEQIKNSVKAEKILSFKRRKRQSNKERILSSEDLERKKEERSVFC